MTKNLQIFETEISLLFEFFELDAYTMRGGRWIFPILLRNLKSGFS